MILALTALAAGCDRVPARSAAAPSDPCPQPVAARFRPAGPIVGDAGPAVTLAGRLIVPVNPVPPAVTGAHLVQSDASIDPVSEVKLGSGRLAKVGVAVAGDVAFVVAITTAGALLGWSVSSTRVIAPEKMPAGQYSDLYIAATSTSYELAVMRGNPAGNHTGGWTWWTRASTASSWQGDSAGAPTDELLVGLTNSSNGFVAGTLSDDFEPSDSHTELWRKIGSGAWMKAKATSAGARLWGLAYNGNRVLIPVSDVSSDDSRGVAVYALDDNNSLSRIGLCNGISPDGPLTLVAAPGEGRQLLSDGSDRIMVIDNVGRSVLVQIPAGRQARVLAWDGDTGLIQVGQHLEWVQI